MQLFFMRHGDANFNTLKDMDRTLSNLGYEQVAQMGHWLASQCKCFDLVLMSPYKRAEQTWFGMEQYFKGNAKVIVLDDLVPSAPASLSAEVVLAYAEYQQAKNVLIISHMPILGYLISELVAGVEPPLFAPAAVCLVDIKARRGTKVYLQSPQQIISELVS